MILDSGPASSACAGGLNTKNKSVNEQAGRPSTEYGVERGVEGITILDALSQAEVSSSTNPGEVGSISDAARIGLCLTEPSLLLGDGEFMGCLLGAEYSHSEPFDFAHLWHTGRSSVHFFFRFRPMRCRGNRFSNNLRPRIGSYMADTLSKCECACA